MKKKIFKIAGIILAVLIIAVFIFAKVNRVSPLSWGHAKVNTPMFSNQAINGYDPVSYFSENKAIPGIESISYEWNDATWYFSSEANKNSFVEAPEKYQPEFGGYCAFAVSTGFTANPDPTIFTFVEGKLYLFNGEDVQKSWLDDLENNLPLSHQNWE